MPGWSQDSFSPVAPYSISAYVTGAIGFIAASVVYRLWEDRQKRNTQGPMRICCCLTLSLFIRAAWELLCFNGNDYKWWMRLLNRIAILLQFSGVTLLILGWASVVSTRPEAKLRLKYAFIGVNLVLYCLTLATSNTASKSTEYQVNACIISLLFLVAAAGVCLWSCYLRMHISSIRRNIPNDDGNRLQVISQRVMVVSGILTLCYLLRAIAFIGGGVGKVEDTEEGHWIRSLYPYAFYQIPELVPDITILIALTRRNMYPTTVRILETLAACVSPFSAEMSEVKSYSSSISSWVTKQQQKGPRRGGGSAHHSHSPTKSPLRPPQRGVPSATRVPVGMHSDLNGAFDDSEVQRRLEGNSTDSYFDDVEEPRGSESFGSS